MLQIPDGAYWAFIITGLWRIAQNRTIIRFYPLHLCWFVAVVFNIFMSNKSPYYPAISEHAISLVASGVSSVFRVYLLILLLPDIKPNDGVRFDFVKYVIIEKPRFYYCLIGLTFFSLCINYFQSGFTNDFIKDCIINLMLCLGYFICIKDSKKSVHWGMYIMTVGIQVYYSILN